MKNKERTPSLLAIILLIAFCALFVFSAYKVFSKLADDGKAKQAYEDIRLQVQNPPYASGTPISTKAPLDRSDAAIQPEEETPDPTTTPEPIISMDFTGLQEINTEIVAWLRAEELGMDYPVLQGADNEYYLSHLYNREYNPNGSLFVDYRNESPFLDRNTVIYGHNMQNGSMFHSLNRYKDQAFYDAAPYMMLFTAQGDYLIELISGTVENGSGDFVRLAFDSDEEFIDYIAGFQERSTFQSSVEINAEDRIVSLCTCSYEWSNARFVLIGRLITQTA